MQLGLWIVHSLRTCCLQHLSSWWFGLGSPCYFSCGEMSVGVTAALAAQDPVLPTAPSQP